MSGKFVELGPEFISLTTAPAGPAVVVVVAVVAFIIIIIIVAIVIAVVVSVVVTAAAFETVALVPRRERTELAIASAAEF